MSSASKLHRSLLVALAALALGSPAAVAAPTELRLESPTSALAGTTEENVLDVALAQERAYSTYGEPTPASDTAATTDSGDGIAWLPFALAILGALGVGLAGGSRLHLVSARRDATRPAT